MNNAPFWIERLPEPDRPLSDEITAFNRRVYTTLGIPAILDLPNVLPRAEVEAQMRAFIPSNPRYDAAGQLLTPAFFEQFLDPITLPDPVPVRLGLITQWTTVRALPTAQVITSRPFEYALDRIQETSVDWGWPVAVLAASGAWCFGLTPLYWGWMRTDHIAYTTREQIAAYAQADPYVVTISGRGLVALADDGITPQMGTRLPLHAKTDQVYQLAVPQRLPDGMLHMADGFASRETGEFHDNYLPCTQRTLFTQAFKLLGEPYAWGDARMGIFGRDCSRFVQDVYGVTGIRLPRNGDQQARVCRTQAVFTPEMTDEMRRALLVEQVMPGALLFLPGHVMLYLGHLNGEPYAIHNTSSGGYSEVIVSPLGALLSRLTEAATL